MTASMAAIYQPKIKHYYYYCYYYHYYHHYYSIYINNYMMKVMYLNCGLRVFKVCDTLLSFKIIHIDLYPSSAGLIFINPPNNHLPVGLIAQ